MDPMGYRMSYNFQFSKIEHFSCISIFQTAWLEFFRTNSSGGKQSVHFNKTSDPPNRRILTISKKRRRPRWRHVPAKVVGRCASSALPLWPRYFCFNLFDLLVSFSVTVSKEVTIHP